jgi:hypothetical protein
LGSVRSAAERADIDASVANVAKKMKRAGICHRVDEQPSTEAMEERRSASGRPHLLDEEAAEPAPHRPILAPVVLGAFRVHENPRG